MDVRAPLLLIVSRGADMSRSPRAALSPAELNALRRLLDQSTNIIPQERHKVFISMGLARVNKVGRIKLTEQGLRRLGKEENVSQAPAAVSADLRAKSRRLRRLGK